MKHENIVQMLRYFTEVQIGIPIFLLGVHFPNDMFVLKKKQIRYSNNGYAKTMYAKFK